MPKQDTHTPAVPRQALIAIGELLAFCRKERKWRQSDLASRIGITRQTVARLEKGDPGIAIGFYFTAAWLLDLPIFPGVENKSSTSSNALTQLFEILKDKYPQRITRREKKIENDF